MSYLVITVRGVKITVQVKLLPTPSEAMALKATLHECNRAANWVSRVAFDRAVKSRNDLQKLVYGDVKASGLGAQATVRTVKKVVDAYAALRANLRAGRLGPMKSKRRSKAEANPITFRMEAAQPFDDRMLSWRHDTGKVSIWTVHERIKGLRFTGHPRQLSMLRQHRRGESDLICRDGMWFLQAVCEIPEETQFEPVDWIGVDRGVVNLATTSDGRNFSGRRLNRYRRRQARLRAVLQAKRTRSAIRRLKQRTKKEHRHAVQVNHRIAKEIVTVAKRTERGVALEDLRSIRDRVRLRRDQRATLSSWPFGMLGEFIAYKARRCGVPVVVVDARYTSQKCPRCQHVARSNRRNREYFECRNCGLAGPADIVAGVNVRDRARLAWGFVNGPAPST